mmetsp:Transcript_36060/g.26795  ORF Transcript_36060/g.26795 Transcript_36060/m.26795 type:complete len:130 (+) Transcript_36060:246-635(+)
MSSIELYQRKMYKTVGRSDMLKCIPIIWQELEKIKTRVEDVSNYLSIKRIKAEKTVEFKKQLLSNHKLKEYFKQNPQEKEVLLNDIKHAKVGQEKFLFKHLSILPSYAIPKQIMATNEEQLQLCSFGSS